MLRKLPICWKRTGNGKSEPADFEKNELKHEISGIKLDVVFSGLYEISYQSGNC